MTIQFSDLDFRTGFSMLQGHAAKGNVLLENWRTRAASDDADLVAADMNAVAMGRRFFAVEFEANQFALWVFLAFQ